MPRNIVLWKLYANASMMITDDHMCTRSLDAMD